MISLQGANWHRNKLIWRLEIYISNNVSLQRWLCCIKTAASRGIACVLYSWGSSSNLNRSWPLPHPFQSSIPYHSTIWLCIIWDCNSPTVHHKRLLQHRLVWVYVKYFRRHLFNVFFPPLLPVVPKTDRRSLRPVAFNLRYMYPRG